MPKTKKQSVAIGFYVAPTLPHRHLKNDRPPQNPPPPPPNGEQPLRERLKAEEKAKISFRFGTNVAIPITQKLGIETALQYEKICHTQRHLAHIEYRENEATTDENGDITSAYKYSLDTSYGEVEVDFEVTNSPQNDGRDFQEGDMIPLRFKSRHEISMLSMPLLVSYEIFEKNNFSFDVRGGLVGKYLAKRDIKVQEIATERNRIKPKHDMRTREFKDLRRTSLDYQIGLAFNYGLNSKINLSIQPTFTRAFKAIHTHKHIKTVPMQTSLNIGVSYNL